MFYTTYKITNKINAKFYIGKHQTMNLDDGYMGSGKLIKAAIKKYGIENFTKEILFILQTEDEMNAKEAELVIVSEKTYNLCPGGRGGFGYINQNGLNNLNKNWELIGAKTSLRLKGQRNPSMTKILKERHALGLVKYNTFLGKNHTELSKSKISETKKRLGTQSGEKNSQFGKPRSEEVKAKIRQTLLNKKQKFSS